jgi:hypothetical protein
MPIDRKEAIRQYKERPRGYGVVVARNLTNGKAFVFSGIDPQALINRNRTQLRFGGHPNKALQGEWNAVGEEQFAFEVVDTLSPPADAPDADLRDECRALEALWMEKLAPYEPAGYHRPPRTD